MTLLQKIEKLRYSLINTCVNIDWIEKELKMIDDIEADYSSFIGGLIKKGHNSVCGYDEND